MAKYDYAGEPKNSTAAQRSRADALLKVKLENQRIQVLQSLGSKGQKLFKIIEEYVKSRRSSFARLGRVRFEERYTADHGELTIITFIGEDGFSFALYMDMEGGWNYLNVYDNCNETRLYQLEDLYLKLDNAGFNVKMYLRGDLVNFG